MVDAVVRNGPARQAVIDRWRRRSRMVGFWRIILPLSIFAIGLALAGWIVARSVLKSEVVQVIAATDRLVTNPRFYGRDRRDRVFLLTAMKGVRDTLNRDKFTLENPNFNLGSSSVRAREGIWDKGSTRILLHGDVVAISSNGSRMETEDAQIDTKTGTISNTSVRHSKGMELETSTGKISADDYTIAKNGVVTFQGRVHGVINGR